jgi:hypothetical protein
LTVVFRVKQLHASRQDGLPTRILIHL